MANNTLRANDRITSAQKKAAVSSIVSLPTLQKEHLRTNSNMSFNAQNQASEVNSKSRRIANTTSDINRAIGVQLQGNKQANEILEKGQLYDQQASEKLREHQRQSNFNVDQYNTQVIGQNRASLAKANREINLVDSNKENAQNVAKSNLILSLERNLNRKKFMNIYDDLHNHNNSEEFTKLKEEYMEKTNPSYLEKLKKDYDLNRSKLTASESTTPWEESQEFINYKNSMKDLELRMKPFIKISNDKQMMLNRASMMLQRSGGSLSKKDRMELEEHKAKLKSSELVYKQILNNNQLLLKSLIKIF